MTNEQIQAVVKRGKPHFYKEDGKWRMAYHAATCDMHRVKYGEIALARVNRSGTWKAQ